MCVFVCLCVLHVFSYFCVCVCVHVVCMPKCVYCKFVGALIAFDGNAAGSFLPSFVEMLRINSCFNLYEFLTGLSCRGLHHLISFVSQKAVFRSTLYTVHPCLYLCIYPNAEI